MLLFRRSSRRAALISLVSLVCLLTIHPGASAAARKAGTKPAKVSKKDLNAYWKANQGGGKLSQAVGDTTTLFTSDAKLLAKAAPDECFVDIGSNTPAPPPCSTGTPKVNQAYVWGLAKTGNTLWFGTMANTHCLVLGGLMTAMSPDPPPPLRTGAWVCEFGQSYLPSPPLGPPDAFGDFRPPKIYSYDTVSGALTDRTPAGPLGVLAISTTLGIRAAGTLNNVVLLAGPTLTPGVRMFAYRASDGSYLGSQTFPAYNNIRKFLVAGGVLYAGVGVTGGPAGRILRWTGSEAAPFSFQEVGNTDTAVAELAEHEGRIFVTTWPETSGPSPLASLWMSPDISSGPLDTADAPNWTKVWDVANYEPDPVTATTYGGGALASYNGYLYWGTMHVPFAALSRHTAAYGPPADIAEALLGTHRAISIFRGRNFTATPAIEVLYGSSQLPVFVPPGADPVANPGYWAMQPNRNANPAPVFGPPGFGNFFNNYTWSMAVFDNRLWVGTMDWSHLVAEFLASNNVGLPPLPLNELPAAPNLMGADLFYFAGNVPALPEDLGGVGNYANYGIRNMLVDDALYLGTANPMNLLTDTTDTKPEGGWELLKLTARSPNTPVGDNVNVRLPNGVEVTYCRVNGPGVTVSASFPNIFEIPGIPPESVPEIPNPTGYAQPNPIYFVGSSALWRTGCGTSQLAQVCIPYSVGAARMFQLQYAPVPGTLQWVDITSGSTPTSVCGTLTHRFMGFLAVVPAVPTITSVTPGTSHVGERVTISGSGFLAGNLQIQFNGIAVTTFEVIDDNTIIATVPPGAAGGTTVTVTTAGGTAQYLAYIGETIPTLTEWGMLLLMSALLGLGVLRLRRLNG